MLIDRMVYGVICEWLSDFIDGAAPEQLLDLWDCNQWILDSEIIAIFNEIVLPTFKSKKARRDAVSILHGLIWEYYLFRRTTVLAKENIDDYKRFSAIGLDLLVKPDQLTASEFYGIITDGALRQNILLDKATNRASSSAKAVFLTGAKINPLMWDCRFKTVVRQIYEAENSVSVLPVIGCLQHPELGRLTGSPDGVVSTGRLLEIKVPISREIEKDIIPYPYYCALQVQMEVSNVPVSDYCECRFLSGDDFVTVTNSSLLPQYVGALIVYGMANDRASWKYIYSPLFPNTQFGRNDALAWLPAGSSGRSGGSGSSGSSGSSDCPNCRLNIVEGGEAQFVPCLSCSNPESVILEKKVWQIQDWQQSTVYRNPRWWSIVGRPAYNRFCSDLDRAKKDPLYLAPMEFKRPMIIEEAEFFGPGKM